MFELFTIYAHAEIGFVNLANEYEMCLFMRVHNETIDPHPDYQIQSYPIFQLFLASSHIHHILHQCV